MKSIKIIIYICVAFLPYFIDCNEEWLNEFKSTLNRIADSGIPINDIFMPTKNGYIGSGYYSVVFKGTLLYPKNIEVAMKFTYKDVKTSAEKEYKIMTYLHAIDNPEVESYGIPNVYYYGVWEDYTLMGITLLDQDFSHEYFDGFINENDYLIFLKEFVRISKYIHSCGVQHNDIASRNIMFRKIYGFIIDYNLAEKMYSTTTINSTSLKAGIQMAKKDWRTFLQLICDRFDIDVFLQNISTPSQISEAINKMEIQEDEFLTKLVKEMAAHVFYDRNDMNSPYDRIYNMIEEELEGCSEGTPSMFHWIQDEAIDRMKQEFQRNPTKPISSIRDPFKLTRIDYPAVDFQYFDKKIQGLRSSSSGKKKMFSTVGSSKFGSDSKKKHK